MKFYSFVFCPDLLLSFFQAATSERVFQCKLARLLKLFICSRACTVSDNQSLMKPQLDGAIDRIALFSKSAIRWLKARLALDIPSGITMEDLQGAWKDNLNQELAITNTNCRFDRGDSSLVVEMSEEDGEISFHYSQDKWTVEQQQSRPNDVLWKKENSTETIRWCRRDFQSVHPDPYADLACADSLFSNDEFCYCLMVI